MAGAERNEGLNPKRFVTVTPSERSSSMKKLMLISFALTLVMSLLAVAQEHFAQGIFSSVFKPGKAVLQLIDSLYK